MKRSFYLITGFIMLFALMSSCSSEHEAPIRVGTNTWPGYEPGYIAEASHFYGDADIRMRQFTSATEVLRAFRSEAIDVAALTLDEVLLLAQDGLDIAVIFVTDISAGADVIVARPELTSVTDLKDKRIAVENTALGAYVLARALEIYNVDPVTVTPIPITVDESSLVFEHNRADAVVTFDPYRTALLAQGAIEIFSSTEMPGEIVDVLVTRRSTIVKDEKSVQLMVEGWLKAIDTINQKSKKTQQIIAKRTGLEADDVYGLFEGLELPDKLANYEMLAGEHPMLSHTIDRLAELLIQQGLITNTLPGADIIDGFALEEE